MLNPQALIRLTPSRAISAFALATWLVGCQGATGDVALDSSANASASSDALTASGGVPIKSQRDGGKCIDVFYGNNINGTAVQLATCYGTAPQAWTYTNGQLRIFDNKCLDVVDGVAADGTKLQIWECGEGNANQQWTRRGQQFVWRNQYCIDLTDGNTNDLTRLQIWTCFDNNDNQKWTMNSQGGSAPVAQAPSTGGNNSGNSTNTNNGGNAGGTAGTGVMSNVIGAATQTMGQPANSLNVLDYGVRGDGSTDNTGTLQAAFDAAASQNKIAWIPAGTYNHSGIVRINGAKVVGSGQNSALHATQQYNSAITLTGNNPSLSNVFTAVSASNRSSQPFDCAVLVQSARGAKVFNVSVQGASANGIRVDISEGSEISNNFINGSNADGLAIVNGSVNNVISKCQVNNASDDSFSSNSYPGERQSYGNVFQNCYAGPNYKQGRGFCMMGSRNETIRNSVSKGSLWHGIVAGTDPGSTTQQGANFTISNNLVFGFASGLPVMITDDGGMNSSGRGGLANVSGTMTSGDPAQVLGWSPITNVADPSTFSSYTGGGPGSANTPGNRG